MVSKITYKNVDDDCNIAYAENLAHVGQCLNTLTESQLNGTLDGSYKNWTETYNPDKDIDITKESYKQLIDVILFSKMLCERYIKKIGSGDGKK